MRVVIQRSLQAKVKIDNDIVGSIDYGLVVLVGFTHNDNSKKIDEMVNKIIGTDASTIL